MNSKTNLLSALCMAGGLAFSGCLFQNDATTDGDEPKPSTLTTAAVTASAITWYQYCSGCITPTLEYDYSTDKRSGYTFSFNYPVIPATPLVWHGPTGTIRKYQPPFTNFADMDASLWDFYMLQAGTGRIAVLKGSTWSDLPTPPKGARRIGVNGVGNIAILTNEVKTGGYGIQVYSAWNKTWVDIIGAGIDLDYDSNGDLWVISNNAWAFRLPAGSPNWVGEGDFSQYGATEISAGGGKIAAITNVFGGKGNTLMQWTYSGWKSIPGNLDHLNIDAGGRLWGSSNQSITYYCQL
ncbi:MAG: hypothetical protein JWP91_1072 [Fibrobacteres bacterium]|nr:hypothetical protein [Fibrobacterota bacterium]